MEWGTSGKTADEWDVDLSAGVSTAR
jgi:hypothetical protein